jgi:hypothetical protein
MSILRIDASELGRESSIDKNPFSSSTPVSSFCENNRPLKLPRRDASMQKRFVRRFGLPATVHELVSLHHSAHNAPPSGAISSILQGG